MKFLCTKVRPMWLELPSNRAKILDEGLTIQDPFIGISIKEEPPSQEDKEKMEKAIKTLFTKNAHAFQIRVIDI